MPFPAEELILLPARKAVDVPAPANVPSVCTVAFLSAFQLVGSVAVALVPIPSKFSLTSETVSASDTTGRKPNARKITTRALDVRTIRRLSVRTTFRTTWIERIFGRFDAIRRSFVVGRRTILRIPMSSVYQPVGVG